MMTSRFWLTSAAVACACSVVALAQQPAPAPVFTTQQAAAGRPAYERNCASCHQVDLGGSNEAPQLAGGSFIAQWGDRPVSDLIAYIMKAMPPDDPGGAGQPAITNIVAYILQANGAAPGTQLLTPQTASVIRTVAMQQAPPVAPAAAPAQAGGRAGGAGGDGDAGPAPQSLRGLILKGDIPNYVPVTDEMLRSPDAGDWLMVRRNYQGWSYSPLTQITRDNVKNLRLAWVWAMNEGGVNEPMPLAHNGILYLVHTGNIVQALNGRTGEVIWEYRAGPDQGGAMRNLAIYQDKVFVATSDARMVALNARTGELAWETRFADSTKGYRAATGPIVIKGKLLQGLNACDRFKESGCYISALDAATGRQLWQFNTVARPEEPGGDTWGKQPMMFRAGGETWITGSYDPELNLTYWGNRPGQAVGASQPWHVGVGQGAVYELNTRVESRHREAVVVLPARARRSTRSRRSVRARARGRRWPEAGVHHRQARHPVETRSPDGPVSQLQGNALSERVRYDRHEDRCGHVPGRHSGSQGRRLGQRVPEHTRRSQLAGHELPPWSWPPRDSSEPELL
jgi:alcohol dehydrogenase (cytochrome c)